MAESGHEFKSDSPLVQVKSIHRFMVSGSTTPIISVKVQCCYCFKEHMHRPGIDLSKSMIVPDELGHREADCFEAGSENGYNISAVAWKKAKRIIHQQ